MSNYTEEKAMAEGLAAAAAGLPRTALNDTPYTYVGSELFRNAWLVGWRNGGGDIRRGVVATERERLMERRSQLLAELAKTESKLGIDGPEAILRKVEAYMSSEDGPLYRLWENCDIGDYDDYQTNWEQTLFDLRDWKNGCVPVASLGGGTEWPEVLLYREILQCLQAVK